MSETFKNTLDMIPNGVLIMNLQSSEIEFANKEMLKMAGAKEQTTNYSDLDGRLTDFVQKESSTN